MGHNFDEIVSIAIPISVVICAVGALYRGGLFKWLREVVYGAILLFMAGGIIGILIFGWKQLINL